MGLQLYSILSQGWLYRGEGNANVVLWLPKTHQILRINKTKKPSTLLEWIFNWLFNIFKWDYTKEIQTEMRNLDFYNFIMVALLGETYVSPATGIFIQKKEVQKLNRELMPFRPEHRKTKCLQYGTASLMKDYAFLSAEWNYCDFEGATYAIEIKPKQGWIPLTNRALNKCQFCLNQYLKKKNAKIKELSSYCPLDLFSGNPRRMKKALRALICYPQNNLRVFKDGIYVYGEDAPLGKFDELLQELYNLPGSCPISLKDDFGDLLIKALLRNFEKENDCCDNKCDLLYEQGTLQDGCVFTEPVLPQGCVLEKILSVQKLNNVAFKKYCDIHDLLNESNYKYNEWSYIDNFLVLLKQEGLTPWKMLKKILDNGMKNVLSDLQLAPYLIATVANDCSFMITVRKLKSEDNLNRFVLKSNNGCYFLVNIGIFDLYPKPRSTIKKHIKRNTEILDAYTFNKLY